MFDILSPQENIQGSFVLEASAGTGKTFAIQHLFIRLLLEGDAPATVHEILAITFTKEAQKEMEQRIWATLKQIHKAGPHIQDLEIPYVVSMDVKNVQIRTECALSQFFSHNISTIHGFFHKTLQAISLKSPWERGNNLHQARKEALRTFLYCGTLSSNMQQLLMKLLSNQKTLQGLFSAWDSLLHQKDPKESFEQAVNMWGKLGWDVAKFESDFDALHSQYMKPAQKELSAVFPLLKNWLERGGHPTQSEWEQWLLHQGRFVSKISSKNKRKRTSKELNFYKDMEDVLYKIFSPLYSELAKGRALEFFVVQQSQRYFPKNRGGGYSFDGLLYAMRDCVKYPSFVAAIRKKFRYVIVDEFQDTDPLQWDILKILFLEGENPSSMVIVGDPKQSIYGFRKADVYSYFQAVSLVGKENVHTLSTNYRSSPSLNNALNALFSAAGPWLDLPLLPNFLSCQATSSPKEGSFVGEAPPCVFCVATGTYNRSFPTKKMELTLLFPFLAQKIGVCLRNNMSVAVLVKDRYQAERVSAFLQKHHFPACLRKGRLVTEGKAFTLIYTALKAILSPKEKGYFSFLFYSVVGVGSGMSLEHERLSLQESWERWLVFCENFEGSVLMFLQALRRHSLVVAPVSTCLSGYPEIEEEFIFMESLLAKQGCLSLEEGIACLEGWKNGSAEEQKGLHLAPPNSGGISVMTVFASKGLEFDAVFVLGPSCAPKKIFEKEELAEEMRELYVAMTRAKQRLYVFCLLEKEGRLLEKELTTTVERFLSFVFNKTPLLCLEDVHLPPELLEAGVCVEEIQPQEVELYSSFPIKKDRGGRAPSKISLPNFHRKKLSFTLLKQRGKRECFSTVMVDSSKRVANLPQGLAFGTFLHNLLAEVLWKGCFSDKEKLATFLRCFVKHSCYSSSSKVLQEVLEHLFFAPFYEGLSLSSILKSPFLVETPFVFWHEGFAYEGKIDLLISIEGKVYFIDWKSHFLGEDYADYSQEALCSCMVRENYFLQCAVYAEAISRGLLQRAIQDITFGGGLFYFIRGQTFYKVPAQDTTQDLTTALISRAAEQGVLEKKLIGRGIAGV